LYFRCEIIVGIFRRKRRELIGDFERLLLDIGSRCALSTVTPVAGV